MDPRTHKNIAGKKQQSTLLVDYVQVRRFSLQNTPRTFTHHSSNGQGSSILDLMFTKGHATTIVHGWSCDTHSGGKLDRAVTKTLLLVGGALFTPRCLHRLTDWAAFEKTICKLRITDTSWVDATSTLVMAKVLNDRIQEEISATVPWSKPSIQSKQWWTSEISELKNRLAHAKQHVRTQLSCATAKQLDKRATNKWRKAIREAQWKHWEETSNQGVQLQHRPPGTEGP